MKKTQLFHAMKFLQISTGEMSNWSRMKDICVFCSDILADLSSHHLSNFLCFPRFIIYNCKLLLLLPEHILCQEQQMHQYKTFSMYMS